ncbi:MAG: HIT family protein [Rhodothermia bacterium]|nr:HIT family protein [Rhodothermia bacterium]
MATTSDRCVFCRIVSAEEDARIVYSRNGIVAFLDNRPLFPGHVLVVPDQHRQAFEELESTTVATLFSTCQLIARAVEEATGSEGTFVALNNKVSQSVPHVHVHVVPRNKGDGLRGFFWPRNGYRDNTHADQVCDAIRASIVARLNR